MVKKARIGNLNVSFTFAYRYSKGRERTKWTIFREWKLGLRFRKDKIVGQKGFSTPSKWKNNLVPNYTFGVDLLIFSIWIDINVGGKRFS